MKYYENDDIIIDINNKTKKFLNKNEKLLIKIKEFRLKNIEHIDFIYESHKKINMYLAKVKIMIITANEIERDSLFAYFSENNAHHIVKIAKNNLVYSFFRINRNQVVHIEPANIGAYSHGGAAATIKEAIKVVKPNIVMSVGVAFGANYKDHKIGDVLVGKQHFSYDKGTKISSEGLGIKKLHIEEADEYMLSRFKANISTEEKLRGIFNSSFKVVLGNMVTGEFVVDSIELRNMIFSPFRPFGIIGGEMEAYGIFEEIRKHENIHCMLMKGICDWGAGKNENFKNSEISSYNPKNDFQTLAMINACIVCEKFLMSEKMFDDLKIKGMKKYFWRSLIGKIIKHNKVYDRLKEI